MSISTILPPLTVMPPNRVRLSIEGCDGSNGAVDERRMHDQADPRVEERLAGDSPRAPDLPRFTRWTEVHAQHDVRVKHLEQRLEVTFAGGREERVNDLSLSFEVDVGHRFLALDAAARAAGELAPLRASGRRSARSRRTA
jgi:hypothetical protein